MMYFRVLKVANTVIEGAHVPDPVLDVLDPDAGQLQEDIVVGLEIGDAPILVTVEIEDGLQRSHAPGLADIATAHVREARIIGEVIILGQGKLMPAFLNGDSFKNISLEAKA